MGSSKAKAESTNPKIAETERELQDLYSELDLDLAQAALDVVGIADPTPISDGLSAAMSIARGDWLGAGLSLVSMVPYAGDALAKTTKGAKLAAKITKLEAKIAKKLARLNKLKQKAAQDAASALQRARADKAKQAITAKKKKCSGCKVTKNPYGTRLPADGKWRPKGSKGNGDWYPDPTTERGKKLLEATDGKPIPYKDGYPDFSQWSKPGDRVKIDMQGDHYYDFKKANEAAGYDKTPKDMVWHHREDGTTMELLPKEIHNNAPHTGGNSIVNDKGY